MPGGPLELTIGANVQPAITAINDMKLNLQKLKDQLSKTTDPTEMNRLTSAIVNQKNQLQSALAPSLGFANSTFGVSRAARAAHSDLGQASRSIQLLGSGSEGAVDAMSNLLFTFERLKGVTGSASGALAAIGETLLSPAGLVAGLGIGVSLLGGFVEKLFESKGATDEAKTSLEGYNQVLEDVKKTVEGLKSNLNFSNELGAINTKIFGQAPVLDLQGQSVAQRQFTQDLIDQQEALQKKLDDLAKDESKTDKQRLEETAKFNQQLADLRKQQQESEQKQSLIYRQIALQRVEDQKDADKQALEAAKKAAEERARIAKDEAKNGFIFHISDHPEIQSLRVGDTFFDKLKADINKKSKDIEIAISPKVQLHLDQRGDAIKEAQKQLADLNKIVSDGMAEVAASFAQGIGSIIGGGDISGAFQAVFKAIGGALQALGKAMIAHAIAIQALKKAFANPVAEAAAGFGLIIAGAALQTALSKSAKFAMGGLVSGPVFGLVGEGPGTSRSNPEVIAPLDKIKGLIGGLAGNNVNIGIQGIVKGNDLALILSRNDKSNKRNL